MEDYEENHAHSFMQISQPLRSKIIKYFMVRAHHNPEKWINGGVIEELAFKLKFKPSNGSRRCRELACEGVLERKLNLRRQVEYRYRLPEENAFDDDPYDC